MKDSNRCLVDSARDAARLRGKTARAEFRAVERRKQWIPLVALLGCTLSALPALGNDLTVVSPSPFDLADAICKEGYPPPQCTAVPYDTRQNLAFQGNGFARPAVAFDNLPDWAGYATLHQPEFANDGSYGNGASWISDSANSWIKIDLGRTVFVERVTLGRDRAGAIDDRDPGQFRIAVALADDIYENGNDGNDADEYTQVFDSAACGFSGVIHGAETLQARFTPRLARFVKLTVANKGADLDEVEVFGPGVPFSRFVLPKVAADFRGASPNSDGYALHGELTLGAASDGITPIAEDVVLTVGTSDLLVPAGSFADQGADRFEFDGNVDGARIKATLVRTGETTYSFHVRTHGVDLSGTANPVRVGLTIGDDFGLVDLRLTGTLKRECPSRRECPGRR
jgi:hypothetical protein